jgi:serine/threonine-protein phosphatase 2A activator
VMVLNQSVRGTKVSDIKTVSPHVQSILDLLNVIDDWLADFPPLDNPQRFGNKAFRLWLQKVDQVTKRKHTQCNRWMTHIESMCASRKLIG